MLHAVVLPAQAEVQGQAGRDLPRILGIDVTIVVAVVATEAGGPHRQLQRASRGNMGYASGFLTTRKFTLWIDSALELVDVAGTDWQVPKSIIGAQDLDGVLIGAEDAVVAQQDDSPPNLNWCLPLVQERSSTN